MSKVMVAIGVRKQEILSALFGAACILGLSARIFNYNVPEVTLADEFYFVGAARGYIEHNFAYQDHPPMGMLMLAVGVLLGGNEALGWRIMPLIFGLLTVIIVYDIARKLFQSKVAGVFAALFVLVDGLLITFSRVAYLDIFLIFFIVLAFYAALSARNGRAFAVSGTILGVACAVKYSAVFIIWAVFYIAFTKKWIRLLPLYLLSALTVYSFILVCAQLLGGSSHPIEAAIEWQKFSLSYHEHQEALANSYNSMWYQWPVNFFPLYIDGGKFTLANQMITTTAFFPNPILAWSVVLVSVLVGGLVITGAFSSESHKTIRARLWLLLIAYFGSIISWSFVGRATSIYHYGPAYVFGMILLAGVLARLWKKYSVPVIGFVILVLWSCWYFTPLWNGTPVMVDTYEHKLWLPAWKESACYINNNCR